MKEFTAENVWAVLCEADEDFAKQIGKIRPQDKLVLDHFGVDQITFRVSTTLAVLFEGIQTNTLVEETCRPLFEALYAAFGPFWFVKAFHAEWRIKG